MTVSHWFELRQHVHIWLFARLVLRGDRDFIFPVFSEMFCYITLDVGVFLYLQLSFDCWLVMEGSYETMLVVHCFSFCFLRFTICGNFHCLQRRGMYISKCGWIYTLEGSYLGVMKGSGRGIHHGGRRSCGTRYHRVFV